MEAKPSQPQQTDQATADLKETGRVEAFSDGVFAIVITLLVLELRVPPSHDLSGALLNALVALWPSYLAFITSFLVVGIMWANHHYMFKNIKRTNQPFVYLNLFLLMGVTLVPFSTALLAEYLKHQDANIAAMVYSGLFLFIAVFFNIMWWYASINHRLLDRNADPRWIHSISSSYRFGPLLYLAAFIVSIFSMPLSLAMHLILAVFYAFTGLTSRLPSSPSGS